MRKGFTLIELLAVIVILAIIALIATPIVLNIINDSKESATLRSADFYLDGVEFAVAQSTLKNKTIQDGIYNILESGNICLETYDETAKTCSDNDNITDNNELVVEVDGEVPSSGTITIVSGKIDDIQLLYNAKKIVKNNKGEIVYYVSPCKLISGEKNAIGSKYQCKVKDDMETGFEDGYYFYVLSTNEDGTINLIMDRNMYYDEANDIGKVATETNKVGIRAINETDYSFAGGINWSERTDMNMFGPLAAMNYLYNVTKDWSNIPNIVIDYEDEGSIGSYGYGTIITIDNITKITKKDGTAVTVLTDQEGYENLKARMPYKSEIIGDGKCMTWVNSCPLWLINYLKKSDHVTHEGLQNISEIDGYWTLSSYSSNSVDFWRVDNDGSIDYPDYTGLNGVRPVITLEI